MNIVHKSIAALLLMTADSSPAFAQQTVVKYMTFSAAPDYIEELDATIAAFEAAPWPEEAVQRTFCGT